MMLKRMVRNELNRNEKLRKEVDLRSRTDTILKNRDVMDLRINSTQSRRRAVPLPARNRDDV
jgi:hypothetical protein